jgi:diguanylate cyclase (GGDEF)-like protein
MNYSSFLILHSSLMCMPETNILVVDDNADNLRLLIKILREQGYKVRPASSGAVALQAVQSILPDLILLDVMMPDLDGYAVCERLKADERTREIPVIFISALHEVFDKVKAFSLGAVDYIAKPFHPDEVFARVNTHLTIRKQHQQIQAQNAAFEAQTIAVLELNTQLQEEILDRQKVEAALANANQELQRLASLDGLTRVANRRRFDEYVEQEWKRSAREQSALALILCDIDYFKRYNDTYGHLAGDDCLKQVAQAISQAARRPADLVARYGGEEFVVVLPNTETEGAMHVAQAIQKAIHRLQIPHEHSSVSPYVTVSIGMSFTIPHNATAPEVLLDMADQALYEAKAQGRNTLILKTLPLP